MGGLDATSEPLPTVPAADIAVVAPPELPAPSSASALVRLLPVVTAVATMGVMAAMFLSGSALSRNPMFLAFPAMMLVSMVVTAVTGRHSRRAGGIGAARNEYLSYLSRLRQTVAETAVGQRLSLSVDHPDPEALWTLIGGPRMWNRRRGDCDFCCVRVGLGTRPLATRLVAPATPPDERSDPVT